MVRTAKLNDGKEIPLIAWGTSLKKRESGQKAASLGATAIQVGIQHIDTAQFYETEPEAGQAVINSGLPRENVWLTTKQPGTSSPDAIRKSVNESIARIGFKPDLLLIHTPYIVEPGKIGEYWQALERLVEDGTLGGVSLGVSNFRPQDLEQVLKVAKILPVVNQLEHHPYVLEHLQPVIALAKKHNIVLEAYGPLTPLNRHPTGGPLKPILTRIAQKLVDESGIEVDEAAVLLLWNRTKGVVSVTNTAKPERIAKIGALGDVRDLTAEEVDEIDTAGRKIHFRHYGDFLTEDFPAPNLPKDL